MTLRLDTDRFTLRSLRPRDVTETWIGWLDDPEILEHLNTTAKNHSITSLRQQLANYDNHVHYQIGIFTTKTLAHIGVCEINVNRPQKLFMINMILGDKRWWGKGVILETRAALLDHFFFAEQLEKAIGKPLARNIPMIFNYKAQGWTLEGVLRAHLVSITTGERLDQCEFGMLKDEWIRLRPSEHQNG